MLSRSAWIAWIASIATISSIASIALIALSEALHAQSQSIASVQTVPSVVGLSIDSARIVLRRAKLELAVSDSATSKAPPRTVLKQIPERGSPVPASRVVHVTVSRSRQNQNGLGSLIGSIIGVLTDKPPQEPTVTAPPATAPPTTAPSATAPPATAPPAATAPPQIPPQTPPASIDTVDTLKPSVAAPESATVPPQANIAAPQQPTDSIGSTTITQPVNPPVVNPTGPELTIIPPSPPGEPRTIPTLVWIVLAVLLLGALALGARLSTKRSPSKTVRAPVIRPQITRDPGNHTIEVREPLIERSGVRLVARKPAGYASTVTFMNSRSDNS
jgi:hypothetical protein